MDCGLWIEEDPPILRIHRIWFISYIHCNCSHMSSSSKGIDYSKWDNIDVSDSEEEEEEVTLPRVTKFDAPSTISTNKDGTVTVSADADDSSKSNVESSQNGGLRNIEFISECQVKRMKKLTEGGDHFIDSNSKSEVFWSQDRHEVIISVAFNSKRIRPKDVLVTATGVLPYSQKSSAVGSGQNSSGEGCGTIFIEAEKEYSLERTVLLKGILPHSVHFSEEEDEIDWEIDDYLPHNETFKGENSNVVDKLVRVSLHKAVPMMGVSVWWSQPLTHCSKIDINSIEGRRESDRKIQLKEVWDEAHKMFREKVESGEIRNKFNIN